MCITFGYLTRHLDQLGLAIPLWVGAMCTDSSSHTSVEGAWTAYMFTHMYTEWMLLDD